ncbi:MAG: hypothetical protein AAGA30_09005 [Planctomycetota bacterium]
MKELDHKLDFRKILDIRCGVNFYCDTMNPFLKTWLSEAAITTGKILTQLPQTEAKFIFQTIRNKFAAPNTSLPCAALWHILHSNESCRKQDGWKDVCKYVGESNAYLCVQQDDIADVFTVNSGNELRLLLGECPLFEFYVTNLNFEYLLCFNDHDYLIGCGTAAEWVKNKCSTEAWLPFGCVIAAHWYPHSNQCELEKCVQNARRLKSRHT